MRYLALERFYLVEQVSHHVEVVSSDGYILVKANEFFEARELVRLNVWILFNDYKINKAVAFEGVNKRDVDAVVDAEIADRNRRVG